MSKENNVPVNLYGVLDKELARMHDLLKTYLTLPKEPSGPSYGGANYGSYSSNTATHSNIPIMYSRIVEIQDLLMKALVAHDVLLQNKIAELALTGVADETKV